MAVASSSSSSSCIASIFPAPVSSRLRDHSDDDQDDDEVCILTVGKPFRYTIPSFDVIAVELRQVRLKGYNSDGDELTYDGFIRNDISLSRSYPTWMTVKDGTIIDVRKDGIACLYTTQVDVYILHRLTSSTCV